VIPDWYDRLLATGLMDVLAQYRPVLVGSYPLEIAGDHERIEIVCRSPDLPAFARVLERAYGESEGFALYGGELDDDDAVFAEFELDGLPLEVSAQDGPANQRLGAATLGIVKVFDLEGPVSQARLAGAVARGEDWLTAALEQTGLTRAALEALSTENPVVARRVLGVRSAGPPLRDYFLALAIGFVAMTLIVLVTSARDTTDYTGGLLMLEAGVLGALFGARLGLVASLAPIALFGLVILGGWSFGDRTNQCGPDCGVALVGYLFIGVLVAAAAGVTGALRDRYFPRGA
jgi:hypothetical protein